MDSAVASPDLIAPGAMLMYRNSSWILFPTWTWNSIWILAAGQSWCLRLSATTGLGPPVHGSESNVVGLPLERFAKLGHAARTAERRTIAAAAVAQAWLARSICRRRRCPPSEPHVSGFDSRTHGGIVRRPNTGKSTRESSKTAKVGLIHLELTAGIVYSDGCSILPTLPKLL